MNFYPLRQALHSPVRRNFDNNRHFLWALWFERVDGALGAVKHGDLARVWVADAMAYQGRGGGLGWFFFWASHP